MFKKIRSKFTILLALVIGVISVPIATPGRASAAPFNCPTDFFWVVDDFAATQMYSGDPATSNLTTPLGPTSSVGGYNAIGYNTQDNYIWGVSTENTTLGRLVRVNSDGTTQMPYGTIPTGLPLDSYQAGAFDNNGILWVTTVNGDNKIYGINVANNTAVTLPLTVTLPNVRVIDFAYLNGFLYTVSGGNTTTGLKTYKIDLSNGNVTVSNPMTGMSLIGNTMTYAPSLWAAGGRIYMYYAAGTIPQENGVYEILNFDTPNPSFKLRNNIAGQSSGDGASCVTADTPFSVQANNDDFSSNPLQPCKAATAGNIFANDTLYGDSFSPSSVNLTVQNNGGLTGLTIDPSGNVQIPATCYSPGTYKVVYQICDAVSPDVCNTGDIALKVLGASTSAPTSASSGADTLANTGANTRLLVSSAAALMTAGLLILVRNKLSLKRNNQRGIQ